VFDLDTADEQGLVMDWSVPLVEGSSVRTAIRQAVEVARDHPGRPRGLAHSLGSDRLLDEFLFPALALTLYLCAGNADIVPGQLRSGTSTAGRRQAGGGIPGEPRAWEVGWRIGAALRAARHATADTPGTLRRPAGPLLVRTSAGPTGSPSGWGPAAPTNAPTPSCTGSR
jgi:hypothetical protein